jgi:two-component system response regulator DctR
MSAGAPAVHVVDDEAAVRDALSFLLDVHGLPVRSYADGRELLAALDVAPLQGCLLLDVRMEPIGGLQLHQALRERGVAAPVIFLSGHGDIPMAVQALHRGAFDFLVKPFDGAHLLARVRDAMRHDAQHHHQARALAEFQQRFACLTDREREVMLRVAAGRLNKVIADELTVAVRTVEVHRARALAKLGMRSAAEVATQLERMQTAAQRSRGEG